MLRTSLALVAVTALGCSGSVEPLPTSTTGNAEHTGSSGRGGSSGGSSSPAPSSSSTPSTPPSSGDACVPGTTQSCPDPNFGFSIQSCDDTSSGPAWGTCGAPSLCQAPQSCTTADGQQGASCDGGACYAIGTCDPTVNAPPTGMCSECSCYCLIQGSAWNTVMPPCDTPLVLAFEGERVEFTRPAGAFDLVGRGLSVDTDWVGASTPWLAIDLDGNGAIDDGRELFGSMTELPDGTRARNGFDALAALDADGDGRITAKDPAFARLLLWRDADQDRRSEPGELEPASAAGLIALELDYRDAPLCTNGSCEVERARFVFRQADGRERSGEVVDVHLARR
jgi:hypothetical protein